MLGSQENIWVGERWVPVGTAGLGATAGWMALGGEREQLEGGDGGAHLGGRFLEWQWEQLEEGTSGQGSPEIVGRAAGGTVHGWQWEQLDLGNSWMGALTATVTAGGGSWGQGAVPVGTRPSWVPTRLGGGLVPSRAPQEEPWGGFLSLDEPGEVTTRLPEQGGGSGVAGARSLKQKEKYIRNVQLLSLA